MEITYEPLVTKEQTAKNSPATVRYDNVERPVHYADTAIETWDFIIDKNLSYCLGNVVKYVTRCGKKGDALEDLKKARAYLNKEIKRLESR